mmetsp:Transcript_7304/g.22497  ORF Transcript_7304/g.22497 Transcript_7304/m.22497 type:complete len:225 (+) Transcript_7304:1056-1730(+)
MPVHRATTAAIWSGVTASDDVVFASSSSSTSIVIWTSSSSRLSCWSRACVSTMAPYSRSAARSRSPLRRATCALTRSLSSFSWSSRNSSARPRSASHSRWSGASSSCKFWIFFLTSTSRFFDDGSFSRVREMASISNSLILRSKRSRASGLESNWTRRDDAASSTRSIALSGKKRPEMYRADSCAAATKELSRILTPWCASYLVRRPRRMATVAGTVGSRTWTF